LGTTESHQLIDKLGYVLDFVHHFREVKGCQQ